MSERCSNSKRDSKKSNSIKRFKSGKKSIGIETIERDMSYETVYRVEVNDQLSMQGEQDFRLFNCVLGEEMIEKVMMVLQREVCRVCFDCVVFEGISCERLIQLFGVVPRHVVRIDLRGCTFPVGFFIDFFGLLKEFLLLEELVLSDVNLGSIVDAESVADWINFEGCYIKKLDISRCSLDMSGIDAIKSAIINNAALTHFGFGGNAITDSACNNVIGELFSEIKDIESLSISDTRLNAYGSLMEILIHIKYYRNLKKLDLSNTSFNRECSAIFAKTFSEGCGITELNLSQNYLFQETIDSLGTVFHSLKKLILRGCFHKDKALGNIQHFASFVDLVTETDTLESLDLGENLFHYSEHMIILSKYLKKTNKLKYLSLSDNPLGSPGIRKLGAALTVNNTIHRIDLQNVQMGDEGGVEILSFLQWNRVLNEIKLEGIGAPSVPISVKIAQELKERSTRREAVSVLASKEDIVDIVELIMQNNGDTNPRFLYMVPKDAKRAKIMRSIVNTTVTWAQKNGYCFVIKEEKPDGGHQVIGCVVYLPAGVELKAPTGKFLKEAAKALVTLGVGAVKRLKEFTEALEDFSNTHCPDNGWKLLYYEVQEDLAEVDFVWKEVIRDVFRDANAVESPIFMYITDPYQKALLENVGFEEITDEKISEVTIWGFLRDPERMENDA